MAATFDQVVDALLDNADFEETQSASKARAFITAATRYFILQPASASDQASSLAMSMPQIENLLVRARLFAASATTAGASGGGGVTYLGVGSDFRE